MKVRISEPNIDQRDIDSVMTALKLTSLSGRCQTVLEFEGLFADKFGTEFAVAVNSGTSALFLALKALGIGAGDEVIIPDYAYIAVANVVDNVGATPILTDIEPDTGNIDPAKIKPTENTKAIIVVHTYGQPCDMDRILAVAKGIPVIEDAAEAHGALYNGQPCGSIGIIGCFSFFANKTMTTGEGGMCITNSRGLAREIALLKDQYGSSKRYVHDKIGYSMNMGGLQAALGMSQLARLDDFVDKKREIARIYREELSDYLEFPEEKRYAFKSDWMSWCFGDYDTYLKLEQSGIEVRPSFIPISMQKPYCQEPQPEAALFAQRVFCLPCSTTMDYNSQKVVINTIKRIHGT